MGKDMEFDKALRAECSSCDTINKELRQKIVQMVFTGQDGHIPSSFSIVDIISWLYDEVLNVDADNPNDPKRDYLILSKGHGCLALYVNLHKYGFISDKDIETFCRSDGILGEHPDVNKIPGVENSGGSLGHGLSYAVGIALGMKIQKKDNRLVVLMGDGECHEGTVWEAAHVARNHGLDNILAIVDWNQSGMQLLPHEDLVQKWRAFGWNAVEANGHDPESLKSALARLDTSKEAVPKIIVSHTVKGKGVDFIEGHGRWHHRIPDQCEYKDIMRELKL